MGIYLLIHNNYNIYKLLLSTIIYTIKKALSAVFGRKYLYFLFYSFTKLYATLGLPSAI